MLGALKHLFDSGKEIMIVHPSRQVQLKELRRYRQDITHLDDGVQMFMIHLNPLRAKLSRGNIHIYLHCVSFLHIDMTQVLL